MAATAPCPQDEPSREQGEAGPMEIPPSTQERMNGHARPLESVATVNGNHDARGRFVQGNKAAAGNPHARRMAELRSAFLDALPVEKMRQLADRLVRQALD